jgi:hypothetical protein
MFTINVTDEQPGIPGYFMLMTILFLWGVVGITQLRRMLEESIGICPSW